MVPPASILPAARSPGRWYGLLDRRFPHLSLVYDERFAHAYGPWRALVPKVRPLACPRCAAPMRIVAVITDPAVITRILVHRARRSPPVARRPLQP